MNKLYLLIALALIIFFGSTLNAELVNPSFELYGADYNTQALGWTHIPIGKSININDGTGCAPSTVVVVGSSKAGVADANEGNNVLRLPITANSQASVTYTDLNYSQINTNQQICVSLRESLPTSATFRFGSWIPESNCVTFPGSAPASNPSTSWTLFCTSSPTYSGKVALAVFSTAGGSATNFDIDNLIIPIPLSIDILNYTESQKQVGETVTFKSKVLRTDLNQFVNDANVRLLSIDFNQNMIYNSSSGYYETTRVFDLNRIGNYDFNVKVFDINNIDVNLTGNNEKFSVLIVSSSDLIDQIDNLSESEEFFISSTSIKSIMNAIDTDESIIFLFDGNSTYGGINFDLNFVIRNSLLSNERYVVYTATEQDYLNGTWNFDDTLTFGSTVYNGLQRIWNDTNEWYEYSFQDDSVTGNSKKYYKLAYRSPVFYWDSLNPNEQEDAFKLNQWDVQLLPSVYESEAGHKRDYFPISTYNNMRNQFKEEIPDINSNESYSKFLIALNSAIDSGTYTVEIGKNNGGTADTITNVSVTTTEKTYHVSTGWKYPLIKGDSTSFKQLMLSDYALIERGFFLEALTLRNKDGTEIEEKIIEGTTGKVINEGAEFRIKTTVYNRDAELDFLEGKVYFGAVDPSNQVAYYKKDLNFLAENELFHLDWLVDGIIDLNGTSARDFIVVVKATNKYGDWFEIQTSTFKLRQFPSSSADFHILGFLQKKLVGEHLKGSILIENSAPETLRGIKFYLYKVASQSPANPDYNAIYWKDTAFSCKSFSCQFDFEFKDHVLDSAETWAFRAIALLTTMNEDVNNEFTNYFTTFPVNFIDVNYMKIVQTIERADGNYRNTEVIPLTLILRTTDLRNTKEELNIILRANECAGVQTDCIDNIDINYIPQSHIYDISSGTNFYFWRNVFIKPDGSLLNNDQWYRFFGIIESADGKYSSTLNPYLIKKCATRSGNFFESALVSLLYPVIHGCTTESIQVTDLNSDVNAYQNQESRLHIDNDFPLNAPSQECFFCMNIDNNNNYVDNLEQDLLCGSWYNFNSAQIDRFDFYLTNKNSDLSKKESDAQFIKISVPYELVAFNDLTLMKQGLSVNYGTTANTIGELTWQGLNYLFTGFANPLSESMEDFVSGNGKTANGVITNVGFDCNFSKPLEPTYIQGMLYFKVKGIKVLNKQDLLRLYPDLNVVQEKDTIKWLNYYGKTFQRPTTTIELYASDMEKFATYTSNSPLIINEEITETSFRKENVADSNQAFESLPRNLRFQAVSDLIYNNELTAIRRYVPFTVTAIIHWDKSLNLPSVEKFMLWLGENIFWIILGLALMLVIATIIQKLNSLRGVG